MPIKVIRGNDTPDEFDGAHGNQGAERLVRLAEAEGWRVASTAVGLETVQQMGANEGTYQRATIVVVMTKEPTP